MHSASLHFGEFALGELALGEFARGEFALGEFGTHHFTNSIGHAIISQIMAEMLSLPSKGALMGFILQSHFQTAYQGGLSFNGHFVM